MDLIETPDAKIMSMLTRLALENPGLNRGPKISAGVIHKRHLVATGVNSYKTHPLMCNPGYKEDQIYMHAEVDAVRNALRLLTQKELAKSQLYVVRVRRQGPGGKYEYGLARPCKGCQRVIASFGIQEVYWTENAVEIPALA